MNKAYLIFALVLMAGVGILTGTTHTFPALDTNNTFTGTNTFNGALTAGSTATFNGATTITGGLTANTTANTFGSATTFSGGATFSQALPGWIAWSNTDTDQQVQIESGTSGGAIHNAYISFLDGTTGIEYWQVRKDNTNNYGLRDTRFNSGAGMWRFLSKVGANSDTDMDAAGSGLINIGLGGSGISTGGVVLGHNGGSDWKIDSNGKMNVITGFVSNSGMQSVTKTGSPLCSTGASAGNTCTYSFVWPVAFNDTSYIPQCTVQFVSAGGGWIAAAQIVDTTHTNVVFMNGLGGGAFSPGTVECFATD